MNWSLREPLVPLLQRVRAGHYSHATVKSRIMVTHDAPADAIRAMFPGDRVRRHLSRTMQALNAMFEYHRPDLWIFGHWHRSAGAVVDGTRFQCLGELRYCSIIRQKPRGDGSPVWRIGA